MPHSNCYKKFNTSDDREIYIRFDHISTIERTENGLFITLINGQGFELKDNFKSIAPKLFKESFDGMFSY